MGRRGFHAPDGTRRSDKFIHSDKTAPDWDFADFFPNILKIAQFSGAQIGIPITIELQTLFMNKACWRKAAATGHARCADDHGESAEQSAATSPGS